MKERKFKVTSAWWGWTFQFEWIFKLKTLTEKTLRFEMIEKPKDIRWQPELRGIDVFFWKNNEIITIKKQKRKHISFWEYLSLAWWSFVKMLESEFAIYDRGSWTPFYFEEIK